MFDQHINLGSLINVGELDCRSWGCFSLLCDWVTLFEARKRDANVDMLIMSNLIDRE